MTDTEMTRFLAEKCMGWTWHDNSVWLNASEDGMPRGAWEESNQYRAGIHWNPLSSISDALMLVPPMRAKGFSFSLQTSIPGTPDATKAAFSHSENGEDFVRVDAELCRAICLAAIAALEGKNA